jgi:hypothetical protein
MADLEARIDELWVRVGELAPRDPDALDTVNEAIE